MRERGMLMKGPLVRQTLACVKRQTRRLLKDAGLYAIDASIHGAETATRELANLATQCPYGVPGDRLWVRETWNRFEPWAGYYYAADYEGWGIGGDDDPDHIPDHEVRWKPSIHMPRAACRLVLEITDVRIERLQDISEADILAEGITVDRVAQWCNTPWSTMPTLHHAWRVLWESINGAGSWDANPWVWVISFRRVV